MLTKVLGRNEHTVRVSSCDNDVRVLVESQIDGLPHCALSRRETHDVLLKAKAQAEDFIATIDSDIEATEH